MSTRLSIGEFLHPLRNSSQINKCLAALYYMHRYQETESLTSNDLKVALKKAGLRNMSKINVSDIMAKAAPYVESLGYRGNQILWGLTSSGDTRIRRFLDLPLAEPEIEHAVGSLEKVAGKIRDPIAREYIREAIRCYQANCLRATIVFVWSGAIHTIRENALSKGITKLNAALSKHDPRCRKVNKLEDFTYVKDKTLLLATQTLNIYDKSEKETLEDALKLRNRCGHPARYSPRTLRVSSFIEDVVGLVF